MLLKNIARHAIFPGFLILASLMHSGCSSEPTVKYAPSQDRPQATAVQTSPPTPNPDQAAGLITRFYRDADTKTSDSIKDLFTIVSRDFVRNHHDDLIADYAWIKDPKVQIRSVGGRTVSYALDYVYLTNTGKLFWQRTGQWTFNHGVKSGWILDSDTWDSVRLVGITTADDREMVPVHDAVYSDGRHEFTYEGQRFSFLAKGNDWHVTAVATPTPAPFDPDPQIADSTTADSTAHSGKDDATAVAATTQTHFADPNTARAKCPSDIVVWVNSRTGVFHMPGTRWYGMTEFGAYECETDAFAEGDRQSRNGQ